MAIKSNTQFFSVQYSVENIFTLSKMIPIFSFGNKTFTICHFQKKLLIVMAFQGTYCCITSKIVILAIYNSY